MIAKLGALVVDEDCSENTVCAFHAIRYAGKLRVFSCRKFCNRCCSVAPCCVEGAALFYGQPPKNTFEKHALDIGGIPGCCSRWLQFTPTAIKSCTSVESIVQKFRLDYAVLLIPRTYPTTFSGTQPVAFYLAESAGCHC